MSRTSPVLLRGFKTLLLCGLAFAVASTGAQTITIGPDRRDDRPPAGSEPRPKSGISIGGFSFSFGAAAALQDVDLPEARPDRLIFTTTADPAAIAASAKVDLIESVALQSLQRTMAVVGLRKGDAPAAARARLAADPNVRDLQPDRWFQALSRDVAPLPTRFAVHGLGPAPATVVGGTIAMIDTVVDERHEVLKGARIEQTSFVGDAAPAAHGTALAGLIVGTSEEVPGVAQGARLIALAAFTQRKDGVAVADTASLAKALDAAAIRKPDVLNLSFGGRDDALLGSLLDEIARRGICVAAAAGNGGARGEVPFPATHRASLAVTAVDEKSKAYAYASRGSRVDIAAVGVDVFVPVPGAARGGYRRMSGSSMATAFVSGSLLRMPECSRAHAPDAMRSAVRAAAVDLGASGPDPVFGAGLFRLPQK